MSSDSRRSLIRVRQQHDEENNQKKLKKSKQSVKQRVIYLLINIYYNTK